MKYLKKYQQHTLYEEAPINTTIHTVSHCKEDLHVHYDLKSERYNYLRFKALEDSTFLFTNPVEYSLDGNEWIELEANTDTPIVEKNQIILWRGNITPNSTNGSGTFSSSGKYEAKGNPLSLTYGDNFKGYSSLEGKNYVFIKLFRNNTNLINAKHLFLSFSTLSDYCYLLMFDGCINLIDVCDLLYSGILRTSCYLYMFRNCKSLINAPYIAASSSGGYNTSATSALKGMFLNCISLINIKRIPPNLTAATGSHFLMFYNCFSLVKIPSVTLHLNFGSLNFLLMFYNCISLREAHITFIGTTVGYMLCNMMFYNCKSLIQGPILLPATSATGHSCYKEMFYGCQSLKVAPEINLEVCNNTGSDMISMFLNCKSLETAPTIKVSVLKPNSCEAMFTGCSKLKYVKCLTTDKTANRATYNWLSGVSTTGTFVKHPDATWSSGVSGIPSGWTIEDAVIE